MPWFPVDDSFHSHPKVLATPPAALGLWVVAGSWSSAHLTDGVVPDHVLKLLLPDAEKLAAELVASGLWKRKRGSHVFHDWHEWGSKRTAKEVRELRAKRAAAGRKGGVASGKTRSKQASKTEALASPELEPQSSRDLGSVVTNLADRYAREADDDLIHTIQMTIKERTGRVVDDDWALKIARTILNGQQPRNRAAYCRSAIQNEPNPRDRFLPRDMS